MNESPDYLTSFWFALVLSIPVGYWAWRRKLLFCPLPQREGKKTLYWRETFLAFLIFFLIQLFFPPFFLVLARWMTTGQWELANIGQQSPYWLAIAHLVTMGFTGFYLFLYLFVLPDRAKKTVVNPAGKSWRGQWKSFGKGIVWWLLIYPFILLINSGVGLLVQWLIPHDRVDQNVLQSLQKIQSFPVLYMFTAITICTVVPLLEELLFRGFLQTSFRQKLGRGWAIVLTSLVFTLFHFSTGQKWENFELLSSIFMLSIFLGHFYEREGTLLGPIGLHASFNAVTFLALSLV